MQPVATVRCIAAGATAKLPADAIACVDKGSVLELGMPMSRDDRSTPRAPQMDAPHGTGLVLSRTGLHVKVEQQRVLLPTFTFTPAAVLIDPAAYVLPKPG